MSCSLYDLGCAYTQLSQSLSLGITRLEKLTVSTEFQCLPAWELRSSKLQSSSGHYGSKKNSTEMSYFPKNCTHKHKVNSRLLYTLPINRAFSYSNTFTVALEEILSIPTIPKQCSLPNLLLHKTKPNPREAVT